MVLQQQQAAIARRGAGDLRKLYADADTWEVTEETTLAGAGVGTNGINPR